MYTIDKKACADCGYCNYVCPFAAIDHHLDEKYYEINQEKCQQCGQCFDACITSAIHCDADQEKVAEIFINDNCIGCSLCSRNCPVGAITGKIKEKFNINPEKCIKCGYCATKCRKDAITVKKVKVKAK